MRYTRLGHSGLQVSALALGCMSFGEPDQGGHRWSLPEDESRLLIRQALDHGINFFDTANVYSNGSSEEIVGRALADFAPRDEVVIATKVHGRMRPGPNGGGLSRKAIFAQLDASLRRLGTDFIDLYQIHRWDPEVPVEETMEALHDVVKAGKVRYIGASSMFTWQFAKAQHLAEGNGWTRFVSMQSHYNLLYREEEREMLAFCADQGIGILPWSPLARGRLTRPWGDTTRRSENDAFGSALYDTDSGDRAIVERVAEIAESRAVPPAQVALAWVTQKSPVTAPLIGVTKASHLDDAIAALGLDLTQKEMDALEEPYLPHPVAGHTIIR
ncbi:aldo/keto reductase [Streptomyces melanosporofaciens]|uniref:Predicted oxidoreductase n=1 Tax=Streptomyces melanosporofaciens TaxID=67327 RepID=A0A1H5C9Q6_STRMJ|nr:aldo/keto reductase [Streptomyces melanosporofaciens]SED63221.1 Predicted oxidoreductase [Streptomyces melanosporofaciens]